jgi:hypothetical protein
MLRRRTISSLKKATLEQVEVNFELKQGYCVGSKAYCCTSGQDSMKIGPSRAS